MIRTFAPILARNGGGGVLDVSSRMSWLSYPGANAYAASRAAAWSTTNGVRLELAGQGTQVTGLHPSSTDTGMMAGRDIPKNDPVDVVSVALDGLEAGAPEVLADQGDQGDQGVSRRPDRDRMPVRSRRPSAVFSGTPTRWCPPQPESGGRRY